MCSLLRFFFPFSPPLSRFLWPEKKWGERKSKQARKKRKKAKCAATGGCEGMNVEEEKREGKGKKGGKEAPLLCALYIPREEEEGPSFDPLLLLLLLLLLLPANGGEEGLYSRQRRGGEPPTVEVEEGEKDYKKGHGEEGCIFHCSPPSSFNLESTHTHTHRRLAWS